LRTDDEDALVPFSFDVIYIIENRLIQITIGWVQELKTRTPAIARLVENLLSSSFQLPTFVFVRTHMQSDKVIGQEQT
jgi:hypothetical protein